MKGRKVSAAADAVMSDGLRGTSLKQINTQIAKEERAKFAAERRKQKFMVAQRFREGFVHRHRGQRNLGKEQEDFTEKGLRSKSLGQSGELFVAGCPKAENLRGGSNKALVEPVGPNKVLGLDARYIEGSRQMVSLIRIDLDRVFASADHAVAELCHIVNEWGLPCLPHLIVGSIEERWVELEDGTKAFCEKALVRPHLWIILRSAVNCGPNGLPGPKRLLAVVYRQINKALLQLGADPHAPLFSVRGKNPLSPYFWSKALNNETYPTLEEWSSWLKIQVSPEELARSHAEVQTGLGKEKSNEAFTEGQRQAYDCLRDLHEHSDPDYEKAIATDDREALVEVLRKILPKDWLPDGKRTKQRQRETTYNSVVRYAAYSWDPKKLKSKRKNRGAMRHLIWKMPLAEKQAASGLRSASLNSDRTLKALIAAYCTLSEQDTKLTQTSVARKAGVSRKTASKRWSEVLEKV